MGFKGMWIPENIIYNKELSIQEKFILSMILYLSKEKGYCFASNKYIANIMNVSSDRISKIISKLSKKNYIRVELNYKIGSNKVEKRKIIPVSIVCDGGSQKQLDDIGKGNYIHSYKGQAYVGENNEGIIILKRWIITRSHRVKNKNLTIEKLTL